MDSTVAAGVVDDNGGRCAKPFTERRAVPGRRVRDRWPVTRATLPDGVHSMRLVVTDATETNAASYGPIQVRPRTSWPPCDAGPDREDDARALSLKGTSRSAVTRARGGRRSSGRSPAPGRRGGRPARARADRGRAGDAASAAPRRARRRQRSHSRFRRARRGRCRAAWRATPTDTTFACSRAADGARPGAGVAARLAGARCSRADATRLCGRLVGGRIPLRGKLIDLQARERGPLAHVRDGAHEALAARSRSHYRFHSSAPRKAYPMRVRVRRESSYPYALGYSHVGPRPRAMMAMLRDAPAGRRAGRAGRRAAGARARRGAGGAGASGGRSCWRARRTRPTSARGRASGSAARRAPSLRRVLNATGVIVHTNLGRAPLAAAAREAVARAARGLLEPRARPGDRRARLAPRARRGAAVRADRRRGRASRSTTARARRCSRSPRWPARARGHRLARAAGRDRRRLPRAGRDRPGGRAARRGRDDEPHAARRLRSARSRRTPARSCACTSRTSASSGSSRTCRSRRCASSACR